MDRGYDFSEVTEVIGAYSIEGHILRRGGIRRERLSDRPRRWVVERTHSWMNRFRRILVRWEKKVANYLRVVHLACAWITLRVAGLVAAR
jgi:putative transposase